MAKVRAKSAKESGSRKISPARHLPVINPHAAGIDLGNAAHYVCVPADAVPGGESPVRRFGTFTPDLDQMVEWLKHCGVKTVAMESTGVMWIPVYQKLEAAGLEAVLANTKELKHVPGRKSDVLDCQWQQQLHSYGLLSGSFRPADEICRLRTLMRQRETLTRECAAATQRMHKAMQQMGVHLHLAVSDVTGVTGLAIIDAILGGQRDPKELVKLRDPRVRKSTVAQMEAALQGQWRPELLFVLKQQRDLYGYCQGQMDELDQEIIRMLAEVAGVPAEGGQEAPAGELGGQAPELPTGPRAAQPEGGPMVGPEALASEPSQAAGERGDSAASPTAAPAAKPKPSKGGNPLEADITGQLCQIYGVDLTKVPGLNQLAVLIILSEIGPDLRRWRNADAFAAWLGLCPGTRITGGKKRSSRTVEVVNRVAILLRLAAMVIGRTDTCLGLFHRRIKARQGPAKAKTATARKLAVLLYHLITNQEPYQEPKRAQYNAQVLAAKLCRLRRQARELGYTVVPDPEALTRSIQTCVKARKLNSQPIESQKVAC